MKKNAFTLAEVLITLGIIGVVAALTMPSLIAKYREKVRLTQFKKVYNVLSNALKKTYADLEYVPECFDWDIYYQDCGAKCTASDAEGYCISYACADDSPLPSDYNGAGSECGVFKEAFYKNLKFVKSCPANGFANGCTPDIEGIESPDIINGSKAKNFESSSIKSYPSYVLADGSVLIEAFSGGWHIYMTDINGKKGPNKIGHDVFFLSPIVDSKYNGRIYQARAGSEVYAKGGTPTSQMILKIGD